MSFGHENHHEIKSVSFGLLEYALRFSMCGLQGDTGKLTKTVNCFPIDMTLGVEKWDV